MFKSGYSKKQFLKQFFRIWIPKWKKMPPFVFRFYSYKKYSLEFSDEVFGGYSFEHRKVIKTLNEVELPSRQELALCLRELRTRSRLNVSQMAELCKIDIGNYSAMEKGRRPIGRKMLEKINCALVKK